jgi:hypothetical protein
LVLAAGIAETRLPAVPFLGFVPGLDRLLEGRSGDADEARHGPGEVAALAEKPHHLAEITVRIRIARSAPQHDRAVFRGASSKTGRSRA